MLIGAFLLVLPSQALATPQWLPAEPVEPSGGAPDVTTDLDGNSAAAWYQDGQIYVAERPRGGPWGPPDDLQPAGGAASQDPKIVALPDGELVAAWVVGSTVQGARKPPGAAWSAPQVLSDSCCAVLGDAVAGADGTALVHWNSGEGPAEAAVKPPAAAAFDDPQDLSLSNEPTKVAVAPDGSAVAAAPSFCQAEVYNCILAQFRPPGGDWGEGVIAGETTTGTIEGLGLAARSGAIPYTVAWGESSGAVRSADWPSPGSGGAWTEPIDVPGSPPRGGPILPPAGCSSPAFGCVDLASRADGLIAVWQEGPTVMASPRSGTGVWGEREIVGSADSGDAVPEAAVAADGTAVAAWLAGSGSTGAVVRGAHREGLDWVEEDLGAASEGEGSLDLGDVAADGQGDALAGFSDVDGSRAAGFDGTGPRITVFSLPSGSVGQTLAFAAAADDNWSGPSAIEWLFGDGAVALGSPVSHAYGAAGNFPAIARATDAVGNQSERSGQVPVAAVPTAVPPPGPGPDPCGTTDSDRDGIEDACDDNNGAERPRPFRTVNATVVSGEVFVKLPAGSAGASQAKPPAGFVRLEGAETIPVGSTLDTARGRVRLRSAADTRRRTQTGQFFRGRFVIRQVRRPRGKARRRSNQLITDLRLSGSSFRRACRTTASVSQRRRRSKRRVRRLFGDARGSFRTSGRNAAATVRGTRWGVQDRCDGTLVAVQRGRVEVRDKVKRRTIILRAGRTYVARRR